MDTALQPPPKLSGTRRAARTQMFRNDKFPRAPGRAAKLAEKAATMRHARAQHGACLLIDCHSMPSIAGPGARPRIVIGDRHGRSAGPRLVDAAMRAVRSAGLSVARNHPYAGGHTLDRHGRPAFGRHALQIEIDRALYLDAAQREPGPGLAAIRRLLADIAEALLAELCSPALAAE